MFQTAHGADFSVMQSYGKTGNRVTFRRDLFRGTVKFLCLVTVVGGDDPPGGAGGPAVFIVKIGEHSAFFGFINTDINGMKPLFLHIRRSQTGS